VELADLAGAHVPDDGAAVRCHAVVFVAASAAAAATAAAQGTDLLPGRRVRVQSAASDQKAIDGTLVRVDEIVLALQAEHPRTLRGRLVELPVGLITRLQVARGRRSRLWAGVGVGALAGMIAGLAVMGDPDAPADHPCHDTVSYFDTCPYSSEKWRDFAIASAAGVAVGALVGSRLETDAWADVELPRAHVSVRPFVGRRTGVALAVSF
jgi:hypothetical protein